MESLLTDNKATHSSSPQLRPSSSSSSLLPLLSSSSSFLSSRDGRLSVRRRHLHSLISSSSSLVAGSPLKGPPPLVRQLSSSSSSLSVCFRRSEHLVWVEASVLVYKKKMVFSHATFSFSSVRKSFRVLTSGCSSSPD